MGVRRFITVLVAAVMVLSLTASAAFAGEITGKGKTPMVVEVTEDGHTILHGKSACAFSGLNDEFVLGLPNDGRTQNWGQIPKAVRDTFGFNPGDACNPTKGVEEPA